MTNFNFGPDVVWPGVAKMVEEMHELGVPLGKLIMRQGDTNYWGGRDLRPEIVDEAADVMAAVVFMATANFTVDEMLKFSTRYEHKFGVYMRWHKDGEEL